jgi:hypothetical protein
LKRKRSCPISRYYPGILLCTCILRKTTRNLSDDNLCCGQDSCQVSTGCKLVALPWPSYTPRRWVHFSSPSTTRRATVEVFEPTLHGTIQRVRVRVTLRLAFYRQSILLLGAKLFEDHDQFFFFLQLNTCGHGPCVTFHLARTVPAYNVSARTA